MVLTRSKSIPLRLNDNLDLQIHRGARSIYKLFFILWSFSFLLSSVFRAFHSCFVTPSTITITTPDDYQKITATDSTTSILLPSLNDALKILRPDNIKIPNEIVVTCLFMFLTANAIYMPASYDIDQPRSWVDLLGDLAFSLPSWRGDKNLPPAVSPLAHFRDALRARSKKDTLLDTLSRLYLDLCKPFAPWYMSALHLYFFVSSWFASEIHPEPGQASSLLKIQIDHGLLVNGTTLISPGMKRAIVATCTLDTVAGIVSLVLGSLLLYQCSVRTYYLAVKIYRGN